MGGWGRKRKRKERKRKVEKGIKMIGMGEGAGGESKTRKKEGGEGKVMEEGEREIRGERGIRENTEELLKRLEEEGKEKEGERDKKKR